MAGHYARCSQENADDLLQEARLGLLEALPSVDITIGCPQQYLLQRARWRLLDAVKRGAVRACLPLEEAQLDGMADPDSESFLAAVHISDFARRLKSTQRAVLECLLLGFTWREAGDHLGFTSANVAYHVRQIQHQYRLWDAEPV
jgi:RNA polymerase sigma-70 factor (ECF subfamily)